MTSMWMVQNDDGRYLDFNYVTKAHEFLGDHYGFVYGHTTATEMMKAYGGHLVEMAPAKPKVPVNAEEADVLEKAKNPTYRPSFVITEYSNGHKGGILGNDLEDRLMRAYVDGYTVVEPTKYNVKVPHVEGSVYGKMSDGILTVYDGGSKCDFMQFTMTEIKHYGLEDCERVEVQKNGEADNA